MSRYGTSGTRCLVALGTIVATLSVALLALTGCGGSSTSTATNAAQSGSASSTMAAAKKISDAKTARPQTIQLTEPLAKRPPAGTRVAFLYPQVPASSPSLAAIKEATSILGMKLFSATEGTTTDQLKAAISSINAFHPAGVIISNETPSLIQGTLNQWRKQGIPFIDWGTNLPNSGPNVNPITAGYVSEESQKLVDWIYVQAAGKPIHMLYVDAPGLPCCSFSGPPVEQRLKQLDPGSTFHHLSIPITSIGTTSGNSQIVSYLQAHPDTNWGFFLLGDFAIGLPTALKAAGITNFQFVSTSGGPTNDQYIKQGLQAADLAYGGNDIGWLTVDFIARAVTHQSIAPDQKWNAPTQIITKDNMFFSPSEWYPGPPNKVAQWKKLWGVP